MDPCALRTLAGLATLLLAGCASPDPAPTDADEGLAISEATGRPRPATPAGPPEPMPVTATCELTRTNVGTSTGYGLNVDRVATGIDECPLEGLFDGNTSWAQSALIEAVWTAQATQTGTDLWIESDLCPYSLPTDPCDVPRGMGASSPLAIALNADELRAFEGQHALIMVAGQGIVVDLAYTLHVTLFPGDVPSGFTAVP